ncbi:MAG: type 4a pilus biogenesis protein PilO [Gemmatimonadetes bacterium]|nr:type 4a pilus biogenesis protein PilO [Gemmatimonadota bacterium]MBT8477461.1 type 4a pilus biogenesis protein PilO [Gemmatimonadota bacterium]NNK48050.1 type 4a pilus biogenesis protein PilO [Gemmatimonadota bacterium]
MAILPQDQRQQTMLLVVILALAAGALFYNFVHRPGTTEIVELSDRVEDLETQNQIAETRVGNLQALRDRISLSETQFDLVERLVPSNAEVPAIYEAIATESQALDLRLINVEPSLPEPADSGAYFLRQEWQMQVQGDYHSLVEFLTRVASFDRIVRPHVTQVSPAGETPSGRQLVLAAFGLETYVLAPQGAQVATEEGGE